MVLILEGLSIFWAEDGKSPIEPELATDIPFLVSVTPVVTLIPALIPSPVWNSQPHSLFEANANCDIHSLAKSR